MSQPEALEHPSSEFCTVFFLVRGTIVIRACQSHINLRIPVDLESSNSKLILLL